jgi:hypothetical protein
MNNSELIFVCLKISIFNIKYIINVLFLLICYRVSSFYQMSRFLGEQWKCPVFFFKYYGNPTLLLALYPQTKVYVSV